MKRFFILILCFAMLLSLTACGGKTDSADTNRLVIWHDKEDAVITALSDYLAQAVPNLNVQFEKKTSLTDSLKLVGNDPSAAPDLFLGAHQRQRLGQAGFLFQFDRQLRPGVRQII